jgi:glutamine synthetase
MFKNAAEAIKYIRENDIEFVDVRFMDLPGVMQHFNIPAKAFNDSVFEDGLMFDGSSIRGFQAIHESDMKLMPDVTTAFVDPFREAKTLAMNFSIRDPFTNEPYSRDPRNVASKAEAYLKASGIADTVYFGPEAEFYIFDEVRFDNQPQGSFFKIDSIEAAWNTGREEEGGNLGYKTPFKGGYFPVPPVDHFADLRDIISSTLINLGFEVERAHHEVGTAGQAEINYKFNTLLNAADQIMLFKYVVKNVAFLNGHSATFMPKPMFGDNGSGMHCHQSLWKDSYHRLVPGFEAPVNLVYSQRNRSAAIRIPITGSNPKAKRIEFRVPDPSCNPYLAFAAMMMAGIDGVKNRIEPPTPVDKDLYELPPDEAKSVPQVPGSLDAVLTALEKDKDYLTAGGVFTPDLIDTWIEYKRAKEIDPIRLRPTPYEYQLYYDI